MRPKVSGTSALAFGLGFAIVCAAIGYYAHGLSFHYEAASIGLWVLLYPSILVAGVLPEYAGEAVHQQMIFIFVVQFVAGVVGYEVAATLVKLFRKRR
jgi:hypothetical protein